MDAVYIMKAYGLADDLSRNVYRIFSESCEQIEEFISDPAGACRVADQRRLTCISYSRFRALAHGIVENRI